MIINVNLVDLVKRFPKGIYLQKSASIRPRTSLLKFIEFSSYGIQFSPSRPARRGAHEAAPGHGPLAGPGGQRHEARPREGSRRSPRRSRRETNRGSRKANKLQFLVIVVLFSVVKRLGCANMLVSAKKCVFWQ